MKAIILAGGLGTRLRPLTDNTPKPLLKIKDKPILTHIINNLKKHNIKDIILSIGYKAETIKEHYENFKKNNQDINISYEIETEPLGTGGAIKAAAKNTNETLIALNGDNLADFNYTEMIKFHKTNKAKITIALFPVEDVTQYGIADLQNNKIVRFIEKPTKEQAPTNLNNAGAYIIEPEVLKLLPQGKSSIERDLFEKVAKDEIIFGFIHKGQWFPTDTIEKYNTANQNWKNDSL